MKKGIEPAFPFDQSNTSISEVDGGFPAFGHGMSKRFYAACAAMQGILSGDIMSSVLDISEKQKLEKDYVIAKMAYEIADELIKQEQDGL